MPSPRTQPTKSRAGKPIVSGAVAKPSRCRSGRRSPAFSRTHRIPTPRSCSSPGTCSASSRAASATGRRAPTLGRRPGLKPLSSYRPRQRLSRLHHGRGAGQGAAAALRSLHRAGRRQRHLPIAHSRAAADHRYPHPLLAAPSRRRSVRRRCGVARHAGRQERGDQLSRAAGGVVSRDGGLRPAAGNLRQGRRHRSDHLDAVRGRGDGRGLEIAGARHLQGGQRRHRRHRRARARQLGHGHAQSARRRPHRGRRALPRRARVQGPADLLELARSLHRRRGLALHSGNGRRTARCRSSSIRRACRSATTSR